MTAKKNEVTKFEPTKVKEFTRYSPNGVKHAVSEHLRGGKPMYHPVYGKGFVDPAQMADEDATFVHFYPSTTRSKGRVSVSKRVLKERK